MIPNPFAPPNAALADMPTAFSAMARPNAVILSVSLFVGSVGIGLANSLLRGAARPYWVTALVAVVTGLLAFAIWRRQNWARILFSVLWLVGSISNFFMLGLFLKMDASALTILVVQSIMQAIAVVLLFQRSSRQWFVSSSRSV